MNRFKPRINEGSYVFISSALQKLPDIFSLMIFKEAEGFTHIISANDASLHNIQFEQEWSWITLDLVTELDAVGITAAFSTILAEHKIACNVIAGYFHDHLFIPYSRQSEALELLSTNQNN